LIKKWRKPENKMRLKTFPDNTNHCAPARVIFFATTPENPPSVEQKAENADQMLEQLKTELSKNENALDQKRTDVLRIFQKFQTENQNSQLKNEAGTFMLKVALKLQNIEGKANYGAYKKMSAADKAKIEGTMQNIRQILEGKNSQGEDMKDGVTTAAKIEADRQKVLADYGETKSMSAAESFVAQKLVPPVIEKKSPEAARVPIVEQSAQKNDSPDVATNQTAAPEVSTAETNQQVEVTAQNVAETVAATIQPSQNEVEPAEKDNSSSRQNPIAAEIPTSSFGPRVQVDSQEVAQPTPAGAELKKELADQQIAFAVEKLFNNPEVKIAKLPDGSILVKGVETDVAEDERDQATDDAYLTAEEEALLFLKGKTSESIQNNADGTRINVNQHAEARLEKATRFKSRFENGKLTVVIRVPPQTIGEEVAARESINFESKNSEISEREIATEAENLANDPTSKFAKLSDGSFLVKGTYRNLNRRGIIAYRRNAKMFATAEATRDANLVLDALAAKLYEQTTPHGGTITTFDEGSKREFTEVEEVKISNSFDPYTGIATVILRVPPQSLEKKVEPTRIPEREDEDY